MSAMGLLLALVQEKLPEVAWAGEAHRRKCNYYVSTYISTELRRNINGEIVLSLELVCMKSPRRNCVLNLANGNGEIIVFAFELV